MWESGDSDRFLLFLLLVTGLFELIMICCSSKASSRFLLILLVLLLFSGGREGLGDLVSLIELLVAFELGIVEDCY